MAASPETQEPAMGAIARFFAPFHQKRKVSLRYDRGTGTPEQQEREWDAARDVAKVEEDDKYFGEDSPANQDELLYRLSAPRPVSRSV
jgi:hypothetical protein